jgi:predicted transglutaminase-like cysteine proteinase
MLMTVVIDETGGGHAILTVRTNRGDYILDNKRNAIMPWEATGYHFVKRESQDVVGWVGMGEQTASTTAGN